MCQRCDVCNFIRLAQVVTSKSRSRSPADVSEANNLNHTDGEVTLGGKGRVLESVATLCSAKSQVGVQENAGAAAETRFHQ